MVDINDEIFHRYENESKTFGYLYKIQKEESNVKIIFYKWIIYIAFGHCRCPCNDITFEMALRRIYEALYEHRSELLFHSGCSDVNNLVNAINSVK